MNFPEGDWSLAIIGDQWPYDEDLAALSNGKLNRGQIKTGFMHFADMLLHAQTGPLSQQEGFTADDLRNAFRDGEKHAREVGEKNGTKETAYGTAYDSMASLQHALANLADEGNKQIKEIQDSKQPVEAKVPQIIEAIHRYRAQANILAAKYGGNVFDAMQNVLNGEGPGQSARQFAQAHGLDTGQMFRQPDDQKNLESQVKGFLEGSGSPMGVPQKFSSTTDPKSAAPGAQPTPPTSSPPMPTTQNFASPPEAPSGGPTVGPKTPPGGPSAPNNAMGVKPNFTSASFTGSQPPGAPAPASGPAPTAAPAPASPMSSHGAGSASPGMPGLGGSSGAPTSPMSAMSGAPSAPTGAPQATTPTDLMHSFDKGLQAGSAGTGGLPPPQVAHPDPQVPASAPTTPSAGAGTPVTAQAYETPAPISHASAPEAAPPPQMMAGPATSAPAAPTPSGQLPAYASDIRPAAPAPTFPAAPPSAPPSAMPGSAPVHPSAGQGAAGTPTVVRQVPAPPPPPASPAGLGTETVVATATGAVAGAASANATARNRLQRLVSAVARQQPRLAWAAGDRPDNTTVLTTDLASGWIPPGIELPAAITLLSPERRRGDLEALLGEVSVAAGYTPIHHIAEEDEPIPTSPRPRHVPEIDELGWELGQATQWRDGLPRLAHTLAKAASGGTGVLDKEVELLQQHLAAITSRVLDSYPDNVDPHDIGNWQLLAAIDALVAGEKATATYHLAWFHACATAGQAHQ